MTLSICSINPAYEPTDISSLQRFGVEMLIIKGVHLFFMLEGPNGLLDSGCCPQENCKVKPLPV